MKYQLKQLTNADMVSYSNYTKNELGWECISKVFNNANEAYQELQHRQGIGKIGDRFFIDWVIEEIDK